MKIVFMGTPDFAIPALEKLIEQHQVIAVYTQPPRPKGRGYELSFSPVHTFAKAQNIPVYTPLNFKDEEEQNFFINLGADITIVAAYGIILPPSILNAFPKGAINIHGSILPKYRGAAPIQRAIMNGDIETGVTIMQMDKGMDTGDILAIRTTKIDHKTSAELFTELSRIGAELLLETLQYIPQPIPQNHTLATYAPKINKEEGCLDFTKPAEVLERQIRAIPSYFEQNNERIKVLKAEIIPNTTHFSAKTVIANTDISCGNDSAIRLLILQKSGKSPLAFDAFLRGYKLNASL